MDATRNKPLTTSDVSVRWGKPRLVPRRWYHHAVAIVAILIIAFPLGYALLVSTQSNAQVWSSQLLPGAEFASNLEYVMGRRNLGRYAINSLFIASLLTLGKVLLSLTAGLAFVYFRFPGKWLLFGLILLTLMMPLEVVAIALYRLISDFGWGDSYTGVILPLIASATGTFLFRQHFMSIPPELSEAAQLDGATPFDFLLRILIPLSWNAIGALTVLQFLAGWNMFLWPLFVLRDPQQQVIQFGVASFVSFDDQPTYGAMMLAAILASLPPLLVFMLLEKQFLNGFALTREK
jgi:sn-glycerol 3-phosphate transport system permease protein